MLERCPRCGLRFEREADGYWLGAMAINLGVTELAFGVVLGVGMAATWPDVPWGALTGVAVAVNVVVPVVFYPFSKTLWLAVDALLHRMDPLDASTWGT